MMGRVIDDGVTLTVNPASVMLLDEDPSSPDEKSVPGDVDRRSDQADAAEVPALIHGDG